ncbi:MAG: penicillin-binding protein [Candidatus Peribacteraceae bacterium]
MDSPEGFSIRPTHGSEGHAPAARRRKGWGARLSSLLERLAHALASLARWVLRQQRTLGWRKFLLRGFGILFLLTAAYLGFLWLTLPDVNDPTSLLAAQSTVITDRNGVELYRLYGEEDRTYVAGTAIADPLKKAVVAIEDERFFQHGCIEFRSIARAVFARLIGSSVTGGASTLTQQLARNSLISPERTVTRKLREMMLACELERVYDKDKLLELYLNWIPYGQNAYGVEQAAHRYFGVSAKDLSLAQSAVLAAIPQRPSYFNPYGSHVRTQVTPEAMDRIVTGRATEADDLADRDIRIGLLGNMVGTGSTVFYVGGRTDQVLKNLQNQEFITEEQRIRALDELKTMAFKPSREDIRAPHFVLWVKDQVESLLEENAEKGLLEQGGLTIRTTLDWKLQQAAEAAVAAKQEDIERVYGARNIALVAMDPHTREVLAYVGNVDFKDEGEAKVDMVLAARQPGSSFKPFVYATAFLKGYAPATVLYDVPTKFGTDEPQNFDGTFWGLMNARQALGASRNIPAIKAFFLAGGEDAVLNLTEDMGVPSPKARKREINRKRAFDYGWPLAIGAAETPLIEMVNGYSTIADAGQARNIVSISKITDKRGALIPLPLPSTEDPARQVLDPRVAYQVTSVLSDVSVRPNEFWKSVLSVPGFQAAAKTGTSNKCLDRASEAQGNTCRVRKPDNVWTIGYTPNLAAGVWVGNANSEALADRADGLNVAAPIWKDFMVRAHKIVQVNATDFPVPQGIVQPQISLLSGDLASECTPVSLRKPDVFLAERAPAQVDSACVAMKVDRVTGLLASEMCPAEAQELRSFFLPTSVQAERWPLWDQGVQEWARSPTATLPLPPPPSEKCDTSKTPGRLIKPTVRILSPSDGGSAPYPSFQPEISYTAGSSASGVTFLLDGKIVAEETKAPFKPIIRVPRSIEKEGIHTLEVQLRDAFFNLATDSVTIRFSGASQSSGPAVRIVQPIIGAGVVKGQDVTMEVAAESPSGIKYVEFYLDGTLLTRKPKEPYLFTYPLNVPAGTHVIRIIAVDMLNKATQDEVEVIVTEKN